MLSVYTQTERECSKCQNFDLRLTRVGWMIKLWAQISGTAERNIYVTTSRDPFRLLRARNSGMGMEKLKKSTVTDKAVDTGWHLPVGCRGIQTNTISTVHNMSTFSCSFIWPSVILWNSAHGVGGSDEVLRLRWDESCCFSHFIFLEIWTETCLLNASFISVSLVYLTYKTKNLCKI
jgi:hypothetical protein